MKVLVLGATGNVGGAVASQLLGLGASVAALTRSPERAASLPPSVDARIGDLNQPQAVGAVFAGVDAVFMVNAVTQTELQEALVALHWSREHRVKQVVYLSVQYAERLPHVPHFAAKIVVEQALRASGLPYTILQPNNFFQNDSWLKEPLLDYGVYPHPLGDVGVDRVDVGDIAAVAALALEKNEALNRTFIIAGPDTLTGASTAAIWARHLGRPVAYAGNDLDAWERQSLQMLPAWLVFDLKIMYAWFQRHGLVTEPGDRRATEALLGRALRRFDDFAAETATSWKT